jgi:hypothetical protein
VSIRKVVVTGKSESAEGIPIFDGTSKTGTQLSGTQDELIGTQKILTNPESRSSPAPDRDSGFYII